MPNPSILVRHDLAHPDGRMFHLYGDFDAGLDGDIDGATALAITTASPDSGHDVSRLERRFDRLTGAWVLISPTRNVRPSTAVSGDDAPAACPLCPGGAELPGKFAVAVFDNRFPSLVPDAPEPAGGQSDDRVAASRGRCLVVVYTPEHVEHLSALSLQEFVNVAAVWRDRTAALWADGYEYVMAFENHGSDVGATLPHLHGQVYAFDHIPPVTAAKLERHVHHRRMSGDCLGCRLVAEDTAAGRVLHENDHFVAAVPFAPRWPLEVHVRAKTHGVGRLSQLDDAALLDLVRALKDVVGRYDVMWQFELPYLMCLQEAPPLDHAGADDWHFHVELLPPHRSAARLKVRASVETALGVFINDTVPEDVAAQLRAFHVDTVDWADVAIPSIRVGTG